MTIDRICTIGPASNHDQVLTELMKHGMTIARLNLSHSTIEEHYRLIKRIKSIGMEKGKTIKILGDLQGPKIRLGEIQGEKVFIKKDQTFSLSTEKILGNENEASVDYEGIVKDVKKGNRILLNDGLVELMVSHVDEKKVVTTVKTGGEISSHKGVNLPGIETSLPALTEKDQNDLQFLCREGVDLVACSFVRRASHIQEVRHVINQFSKKPPMLIAKIETYQAIQNFLEIGKEADGVMIARGDLGVELPFQWIPLLQKAMINECNRNHTYIITATQMLQSMVENPIPTRAEAMDVFQAVMDGTNAVMLSAESAAGHFPVQAIETLKLISQFAEYAKKEATFRFEDVLRLLNEKFNEQK